MTVGGGVHSSQRHSSTSTSPNLRANGEKHEQDTVLSPRVLMREAAKVAADLGLAMSPCRIRVLVNHYVRHGCPTVDFRTWFLGYADPTGNTAVRNVMRRQAS